VMIGAFLGMTSSSQQSDFSKPEWAVREQC
jgi:hypothetical protein